MLTKPDRILLDTRPVKRDKICIIIYSTLGRFVQLHYSQLP